ncbi:efflux RND transporter periplasmic adaptor subunit [Chloroflexi bacterium TSY]|nr:efflux RND transporter periplasmic adaptor subunit [Chloroflexi bacterium TSY]
MGIVVIRFLLYISVVFTLIACFAPARALPTPTPWPTPASTVQETYTVQRGTMVDQFRLNGQVVPVIWEPLGFRVDGELAILYVEEGDPVEEGELLAELDMPDLLEAYEQAQLTLEQAQDALALHDRSLRFDRRRAELELRKAELLLEEATQTTEESGNQSMVPLREIEVELAQVTLEEIEANLDPTLERAVTKAQLAVEALERQVEERRLRAPFAGHIVVIGIGLTDMRGFAERPKPRDPVPAYTTFIVVAKSEPLAIIVDGGEPRVNELEIGRVIEATYRWEKGDPFEVEVVKLPTALEGDEFRPEFPAAVHLALSNDHPPLIIGDWVTMNAIASIHEDTLLLPDPAVRRFAGRSFVVLQDGDRQRRIDVRTGLESEGQIEILEGLSEGDIVIGR